MVKILLPIEGIVYGPREKLDTADSLKRMKNLINNLILQTRLSYRVKNLQQKEELKTE